MARCASSLRVNSWVELSSFYYKEKFDNKSVKQTLHGKVRWEYLDFTFLCLDCGLAVFIKVSQ